MTRDTTIKISYYFCAAVLLAVAWMKLSTPLITILFSYLILCHLRVGKRRWPAILLFLIIVSLVFYGFVYFIRESITTLPHVAETSIPILISYAKSWNIDLPFSDLESLQHLTVDALSEQLQYFARFAEFATKEFVFLIIGLVVAISIFVNGNLDLNQGNYKEPNNLYTLVCDEISKRFASIFRSFETVMGAQLVISAINTTFTAIFLLVAGLPYAKLLVILTFVVGLLPIVGNLLSNTIICGVALTKSPQLAAASLVYLIVLHKVEYFLNSKIIGGRIKNPMWLTLLGLLLGERLMGIPGMILAPVILHFVKTECSQVSVRIN
ncbi:MAG: AI-2E family transporter [Deltaproteobacteria bacterium]|nr:AI-2E family transporter [Deltaproteobacteria bacterium]